MSIKKIMHKDRHGAQVSIEFGEGGAASQLVEQFLGGMGVPAMQDIPQQHPGGPKGTDTVPAWLTPGEFVMNAEATRMFEPQIEEMNNAGRAVQRQQGGSIPEYKAEGGFTKPTYFKESPSWLTGSLLDSLMQVESGGNPNAVSPAGARGPYQIMPATAANPGYGVTPISPQDVTDPVKSRQFAEMYLEALAVKHPDATKDEVLQMYNAGPGRVLRANDDNPLPQETLDYPKKIAAAMVSDDSVPPVSGASDIGYRMPLSDLGNAENKSRLFPKYDPVAAREEQAKLEAANRIERAKAEEEYNRKNLESRGKGYAGTLGMFGLEVPPENEDIEAQITAIDKQRVLGEIPDTIATARIKALRDKETINQIAREAAAAGEQKKVVGQVSELERQAKLLEDGGYTEDAQALREEAAGLTSGIAGPQAEPSDDENTISGLIDAGNKAKEVETPEGEVVDEETKGSSAWNKVKDFFKEGFGTVLDKGALSEAATLYLGSRALGYGHEGSLNFVAKRYGKGIEDKLAIANKAVGTYTPESITKYKDTGNLNDLALIKTLTDLNKPVSFIVPATGEILDLREAKNEKGETVIVDNQNNVVDTRKFITADEYRARSENNRKQLTSLFDGAKKKLAASNKDDEDFDADAIFNTAEVAKAASQHALANGFNTAEVSKRAPYIVKFITEAKRSGNPLYKDVSDMDLTNMALTQGVAKQQEPNLFAAGSRGKVDPVLWQSELDLEFPSLRKLYNAPEQALFYKALYKYGYLSRSPEEREDYDKKASEGSNGFLEYIKTHSEEDGSKWKPQFNNLVESYRNPR